MLFRVSYRPGGGVVTPTVLGGRRTLRHFLLLSLSVVETPTRDRSYLTRHGSDGTEYAEPNHALDEHEHGTD